MASAAKEVNFSDLGSARRWALLVMVSAGSSIVYYIPYLRWVFPDQMMEALNITNAQIGGLMSAYALTAMICYLPAGILADKVRMKTLSWAGYLSTAALIFLYATLPSSYGVLLLIMIGLGITTILIWWGTRYKIVRLLFAEDEYPSRIGWSYAFYGLAGLLVGNVIAQIIQHNVDDPAAFLRVLFITIGVIIAVMGVLALLFVPFFDNEIDPNAKKLSLDEFIQAIKNPAVIFAALTMFFVYFVYTSITYTTQWLGVVGVGAAVMTNIANIRSYGVGIVAGPATGSITKKIGSTSKVIIGAFILAILVLVAFIILPNNPALAVVLTVLLGFIVVGTFNVTSGQLSEARVPASIFGAATGILSLIGFLPDTFRDIWFGNLLDGSTNPEGEIDPAVFDKIWIIVIAAAVLAIVCALAVLRIAKKHDVAEAAAAAAEPVAAVSAEAAAAADGIEDAADQATDLTGQ
ncbi:MAG: MFS transporter [Cellulomonadaceae bacterium]|jgi:predicted MFS family arabinose efflux permease|nr:MFS transporter [Cellulomonadaceae bacterium]